MKTIVIAGFQHETNTFAPTKARYEDFLRGGGFPALTRGADVLNLRSQNIPIGGFIQQAEKFGHRLLPIIWAAASPSGQVEQETYTRICDEIVVNASKAQADAIYLDLHGAMLAEEVEDGEGTLLKQLRQVLGPYFPIVVSLDFHANVTQAMFIHSDVMISYRTYPHIDMAQTGQRCAQILEYIFQGKRFSKRFYKLPFLIALNAQCTELEPTQSCMKLLEKLEQQQRVYLNFAPGFPAADFDECGGSIWGYSDRPMQLETAIQLLIEDVTHKESQWKIDFLSPEAAVQQALDLIKQDNILKRPIIIADTQDNPGAGADSSTTGMLYALHQYKVKNALIGLIVDPVVVYQAYQLKIGAHFYTRLGGIAGIKDDLPFEGEFIIKAYSDGKFTHAGPMLHGVQADVGLSVLLEIDGIEIAVSSFKAQLLDRNMFKMFGTFPEDKSIVVLKSSVHFRADFQSIAAAILVAKSPGAMLADPYDLAWQKINPHIRLTPLGQSLEQRDNDLNQ